MNKINLNHAPIRQVPSASNGIYFNVVAIIKQPFFLFLLISTLFFTGCDKKQTDSQENTIAAVKGKALVSAPQPLPMGKRNFSVTMGNFDLSGRTWVRLINWTFNETNGLVAGTSWTWFSDVRTGHSPFSGGSHLCTLGGSSSTCTSNAPSGWSTSGSTIHQSWSGSYIYNSSTGRLDISWSTIAGVSTTSKDSWNVTLPLSGLARVNLISSNYTLTHGRGYGSNAPWPNGTGSDAGVAFKTLSQIRAAGLPYYTGAEGVNIRAHQPNNGGPLTIDPVQSTPGLWKPAAFNITGSTTPSSPSPATTLHRYTDGPMCSPLVPNGSCGTSRGGSVIHFTVNPKNRQIAYSVFCACLPDNSTWPCYTGNMHPMALNQIIDDDGVMRALIGIEAQIKSGYVDYQMQCVDYSDIP